MTPFTIIDPPSPLAPPEEWAAFIAEMEAADVPRAEWEPLVPETLDLSVRRLDDREYARDEGGRFAETDGGSVSREGMTSASSAAGPIWRDPEVTAPDTVEAFQAYARQLPAKVLTELNLSAVEVYDNPEDAEARLERLLAPRGLDTTGARGAFDRETRTLVASHWNSDEGRNSPAVFFHEVGHALESYITDPEWEGPWSAEWAGHDQDEGFAHAFSAYKTRPATFAADYPQTATLFQKWDL